MKIIFYSNSFVPSVWNVDHCPTIRLVGRNCDNSNVDATFWNEAQAAWDPDIFNEYEYEFTIDSNLGKGENAMCVQFEI